MLPIAQGDRLRLRKRRLVLNKAAENVEQSGPSLPRPLHQEDVAGLGGVLGSEWQMVCPELPHYSSGFLVLQVLGSWVSVWEGHLDSGLWSAGMSSCRSELFLQEKVTDPDQSDNDDASRRCSFPGKKKNLFLLNTYYGLGTVLDTGEDKVVNKK